MSDHMQDQPEELVLIDFDQAFTHRVNLKTATIIQQPFYPKNKQEWERTNNGTVKRVTFGNPLVLFNIEDTSYLQYGKRRYRLDSSVDLEEKSFLFLHLGLLKLKNERRFYLDLRLGNFLHKFTDPLYDGLDELAADFVGSFKNYRQTPDPG